MLLYPLVKAVHVGAVSLSAAGFVARALGRMAGAAWMRRRVVRILPHVVDTILLASALTLAFVLQADPWMLPWIRTKFVALLAYIALGKAALSESLGARARLSAFAAAVFVFGLIVLVALTKRPLGILGG
jgi:uncharacterized membrane protein SirB2